jgi:predicted ester cyclase
MNRVQKSQLVVVVLLLVALLPLAPVAAQDDDPACEGEYLEEVRELGLTYIRALNAGDLTEWYDVLADEYQANYLMLPEPFDKEGALANDEALLATFPGLETEVHFSFVSADCRYVAFHWTSRGTFSGPMGDIEPTGKAAQVSGISIVEVADGQIVHEWVAYDNLTVMTQIGLMGE